MSSIKWGVTLGIIAAIISIVLGVISGVLLKYIFIRAVLFLFIFFAFGSGLRVLINNFFPELMYLDDGSDSRISFDQDQPGSQINITLGGIGEYAVPEMYRTENSEELGNIEDLISGNFKVRTVFDEPVDTASGDPEHGSEGIDQKIEEDYNVGGSGFNAGISFNAEPQEFVSFEGAEPEPAKPAAAEKPAFTPVFGGDSDDLTALPDLGSMATVFSTGFDTEESTAMPHMGDEADSSQMQYNKGNKPQPLKGDFNPQELAEGIRTVLSKD